MLHKAQIFSDISSTNAANFDSDVFQQQLQSTEVRNWKCELGWFLLGDV